MRLDDPRQFERLIADNRPRLSRIARTYAAGHDVEDLLQDILLQLWRSRGAFRGEAAASTWIYRVALNTAISHARKRSLPAATVDPDRVAASAGHPRDEGELLVAFLRTLNEVNRSALLLYLEGLPNEQIAEVLGTTPAAVAVRLTRLRQRFEAEYVEDAA